MSSLLAVEPTLFLATANLSTDSEVALELQYTSARKKEDLILCVSGCLLFAILRSMDSHGNPLDASGDQCPNQVL